MLQLRIAFHNAAPISRLGGIHHTYKRHSTCMAYTAFSYTVHGKVQGVFFRQHTIETAQKLGVVGWVKNTQESTVTGEAQGKEPAISEFKKYLQTKGSPASKIEKTDIKDEHQLDNPTFSTFGSR